MRMRTAMSTTMTRRKTEDALRPDVLSFSGTTVAVVETFPVMVSLTFPAGGTGGGVSAGIFSTMQSGSASPTQSGMPPGPGGGADLASPGPVGPLRSDA